MTYFVEITIDASRQLSKMDNSIRERIKAKINSLKNNPDIGKPIGRSEFLDAMVWELRLFSPNVRIYYTVHKHEIVIEEIIYEGNVRVHKIGDKRSQRKDIGDMMG
jgi:mRNA-degrading endonuclease RelE of RelBE toxin-antitoxin system